MPASHRASNPVNVMSVVWPSSAPYHCLPPALPLVLPDVPIKLQMTDRQADLYEGIISKHLLQKTNPEEAAVSLSSSEATNIFSDLRKASNHPLLLRTHFHSDEVLQRIASVCCSMQHFGDSCDQQRAHQELKQLSDFDLNYLCLEYPSFLGHLQLPSTVLYDSPKMVRLKTLLPTLIVRPYVKHACRAVSCLIPVLPVICVFMS